jgi:DNA (cytosine-5)-methyltransferase 1
MDEPMATIAAGGMHAAEVRAFLISYYGTDQASGDLAHAPAPTVTSRDRFGLVTVAGVEYQIADIGHAHARAARALHRPGIPAVVQDRHRVQRQAA